MVIVSWHSSNRSSCFTINSPFLVGTNPVTQALHRFTSADMIASAPYVRGNGVSPVDLLGVVWYAHKTLGSSSAHLPLTPSNLFFNPFTITLLVASAWLLLCGYAGVEYLFLIPRSLQNLRKALLSNCYLLSETRDSSTQIWLLCFSTRTS